MSSTDPETQAAVANQIHEIGYTVGGTESAGIYGDQAGAAQHGPDLTQEQVAQNLVQAGAEPMTVDVAALQARIDALEAANKEAADAAAAKAAAEEPKPPVLEEIISALSGASAGVVHAFTVIAERLSAAGL